MIDSDSHHTSAAHASGCPGARTSAIIKCVAGASLLALSGLMGRANTPVKNPYPTMAPLERYLMQRDDEIALARSAGPEAVTRDAEVMVLGPKGYETAIAGSNGFVCVVERSWSAPSGDPEFWNPATRGPICFNPVAVRYCVPLLIKRTQLVLAGKPKSEIVARMKAARDAREFPTLEPGAMCFMMAKGGHLNNAAGHWHPHLMFFMSLEESAWGANLPGSPVIAVTDDLDHVTVFMVPVEKWSDGTGESQPEVCAPTEKERK
ncbi:MAG TPA: hypothetical protein VGM64_09860 [Lacunisphaera sp.]|jgi:hypothetical protein